MKGLQESFSHTSEDGPSHRGLKEKLREAEGNLNYSQYFPSTQEYLPLSRAIAGLRNPNNSAGEQKAGNRRAAELLQFAQECAQVGKLEDLKVGQLDHRIGNVSTPAHSLSASASHAPPLENSSKTLGQPGLEVNVTGLEAGGKEDNTKALSPKTGVAESSHGLDGGHANNRKNSESDGGIILNTYNDSDMLSEGEISDLDQETDQMIEQIDRRMEEVYAAEKRLANENADEESDSDTDAESESDDGDALMDYSKSEPAGTDEVSHSEPSTRPKPKTARILAELSPQDLNTQLRYFHVTKSASQIDRKTPVRCLVCAQHGHMAEACKTLTCDVCGTFNHHITDNCPRTTKCSKCRESGHDKLHCPYKLKNMVSNEIKCDLCQRSGHIEEDCELVWRTSGRPWEFSLGGKNVRLSCYECGKSGHLGNDCPTRRPGKSPGTSTWGSGRNQTPQMSIKSKNEISIKGAARQDPISLDDDEDGMDGQFVRPKVPEPASKGKIQIKASANSSFQNQGPNPAWDPINPRERPTQPTNNYYRKEDRGDWRAPNGPGQPASHENARYNDYRPIDRRSVSPEYRDRSGHARSDRYQAPAPQYQSRRPPPGGDVYRPMPSSAQNAWSRHRM